MLSSPPVRRALTPTPRDILPCRHRTSSMSAGRRQLATASAVELPAEEQHVPDFYQILDIFDAPSRLGESSKLLAKSSSIRRVPRAVDSPAHRKSSIVGAVQPLPAPIVFDGPTRPRVAKTSFQASRAHSGSSIASTAPQTLPTPETFDGPSRLRPYTQGASRESPPAWSTSPSSLILLGLSGGVGFYSWNKLECEAADSE